MHQHGAVAIVPGHAQQAGLTGTIIFQTGAQGRDIATRAGSDCVEYVTHGGESGLDSGAQRMNAALHNAANSRHEVYRWSDANNAGGRADDIYYVVGPAAGANRIPVSVERSYGNRNTGGEPQFFSPERREPAGNLIGGRVFAMQFVANSLQQRIDLH